MPRRDRSKPIRPRWMANSVAMKAQIQPLSSDARALSSAASRSASAVSSGSSGRPSSASAVSPASVAVNTGDDVMFQAVPAMRRPPASASVQSSAYSAESDQEDGHARRLPSAGSSQSVARGA